MACISSAAGYVKNEETQSLGSRSTGSSGPLPGSDSSAVIGRRFWGGDGEDRRRHYPLAGRNRLSGRVSAWRCQMVVSTLCWNKTADSSRGIFGAANKKSHT